MKLDDKATLCIFVRYGDKEFGYRLWDQKKKNVARNRDIIFFKHEGINKVKENKTTNKNFDKHIDYQILSRTPSKDSLRKCY